ncbi:MAG: hypothetical protein JWR90_455 [Marmoricola sp.]|jgi:hypothetical protein|nr:hypothetical protein [Marmoricola sp.]
MGTLVVMRGGLGNQLFQLAGAMTLKDSSEALVVDVSVFEPLPSPNDSLARRRYEVGPIVDALGGREVNLHLGYLRRLYSSLAHRLGRGSGSRRLLGHTVVLGQFIDSSLPDACAEELWPAIVKNMPNPITVVPGRQGVHVRLGDYRNNPQVYGEPDRKYYELSISTVLDERTPVYVFSDDEADAVAWLSGLSGVHGYRFIGASNLDPIDSGPSSWSGLWAMASCERLVGGLSTYSWWAAWVAARLPDSPPASHRVLPSSMPETFLKPPTGSVGLDWEINV